MLSRIKDVNNLYSFTMFFLCFLFLSACSHAVKQPSDAMLMAESAIKQAEESRVMEYAPGELKLARDKLANAHSLAEKAEHDKDKKAMRLAKGMADEAKSDAELAYAKAQKLYAQKNQNEMQMSIDSLQVEIKRNK